MKKYTFSTILISFALMAVFVLAKTPRESSAVAPHGSAAIQATVAAIANVEAPTPAETCRQRHEALNQAFQQYTRDLDGAVTAESIRGFNALVKQNGMSSFDDFYHAMLVPLRYVSDPTTGERVPVFGPLGSDIINPWLAAMGVSEGKPLDEQPMYKLASDVLREHLDFAIIGTKDPNLSLDLMPPELHANARWAYARLNPTNKFDGGFDQPLFYVTIREAAKKLFREDHPAAKLTMADIVLPEDQGGLSIRSCLLCHERDHADVYQRLLGQSYFYQGKIAEHGVALEDGAASFATKSEETKHAEEMAAMFQLAADRVLADHGDKIDAAAVQKALGSFSTENVNRLLPGYDEFYETLDSTGCMMCHSALETPTPEHDPAKFGAFVLTPNNYFKTKNIKALTKLIDLDDVSNSKLLAKASGSVKHQGADEMDLGASEMQQLTDALGRWVHSINLER